MSGPDGDRALRKPLGVTAIGAAVLALGLSGLIGYVPVTTFVDVGLDRLETSAAGLFAGYAAAAALLLFGALLTTARVVAGVHLLVLGAVLAAAAVGLEPAMVLHGEYRFYFQEIAELDGMDALSRAAGLVLGPLTLVLALLPSTFRWVRQRQAG
ncbi:hypothetical protein [Qaidamihabitans albus]|uniref:hypothetical protein n=1 Tax=Qaidamihabitans albus TaxID=2795733 RepID=UPI0018F1E16E|nr:hypothetical protein [Qaidamihabitans albus]